MASTQLQTSTDFRAIGGHQRSLVKASNRLYACLNDGSNLVYQYSDDDGVTWSSETTIKSGAFIGTAFYDSVNGRLNFVYAGGNTSSAGLFYRAITSNVTSGTPGALSTEVQIDAGGANLGVQYPFAFHSPTGSNPRYWIVAKKHTAASTYETRAWHVNVTTVATADTAGNWSTTNFTDLGGNSDSNSNKHAVGFHWTVSSADKVTLLFVNQSPQYWEAVTFDPTAATPTPGTVTSNLFTLAGSSGYDSDNNGGVFTAHAKADYAVFGRYDPNTSTWGFWKSVNGTTWTQPSGWSGVTSMGRAMLGLSGSNFYVAHSNSFSSLSAASVDNLAYRLITTSNDNFGGATAFSDTQGNPIAIPHDTGTSKLYGLYRGSTASPYTVRSDFVSIGGGADTTAPSQATVTVGTVTSTTIPFSATMPADSDVANYKVKYASGSTAPATHSDGTEAVASTATSANAVVTGTITGLTSSTRYTAKVFVQDSAGNWNSGVVFTGVPVTAAAFLQRYRSDGTTTVADAFTPGGNNMVLEFQLATTMFLTGGANAHFRFRIGTDNTTPPAVSIFDLLSTGADGTFKYESSPGVWTTVPASGLTSGNWAKKLRIYTSTTQSSQFGSLRVEQ